MSHLSLSDKAALASALYCCWATILAAQSLKRKSPLTFAALALFALNWVLLLVYYSPGQAHETLIPSASGFLLVYVGVLLRQEVIRADAVSPLTIRSLWLLSTIVIAPTWGMIAHGDPFITVFSSATLTWYGGCLIVLGYFFIWDSIRMLYQG